MAERYSKRPNLVGFELLNEPALDLSSDHHAELVQFYKESYALIRQHSDEALVVFNELYPDLYVL